jgi:hypothetical protein
VNLGTHEGFDSIGKAVCGYLGVNYDSDNESFIEKILR